MTRFRYRTATLVGPWRPFPGSAAADAVRVRLAVWDEDNQSLSWRVPGYLEEDTEARREAA